ncbi:unnamed protein product [Arabidopsis lyrata]|uniref:Predicted protein n=1 Tax=Arabidopsis lyrata subsp. lyrata TaxID=81972 RepID=D7ML75_ARALL|nr:cytochrome c oxidase assembly protein COX15 [Arabidopsis lyrata subsp. lyrata]EFH40690.1 predicted protein [Arabidopsis lyrata subsp. lyrata]CAH8279831.1 unnamed protein product [Arabidopsis lyrata]|eukprot:XP_002864431.1 cytochrome c oxidase assembly protein COX15 [Arabidopsis lyrata subsp. lyrata]
MGRIPCCEKENVKRGQWTPEEDNKLASYIAQHGTRNWRLIPKNAGLQRCGKSCRLRWTNYLRPDLKHGQFSETEEHIIVKFHSVLGNRWSLIAAQLPGRTDNDVKNYWNTKLKKKLSGMGIDPVTHKPSSHRMWGRGLGIMFALPFSYFLRKGYITLRLGVQLSGLFALGAGQGLIGWWMVKSGLEEPPSEYSQPRVSPYRLAAHLTSAFAIYCGLFWTALSVVMPEPPAESLAWVRGAAKVKKLALPVSLIVGITTISGAFVAGNDAGRAFNTFPKMGDTWIPDNIFEMKPLLRNFFENTATVQLDHRLLATTTLIAIGTMWWFTRKLDIHPAVKALIGSTVGMTAVQVTLGVLTLLSYVPVSLGSAHQAGALTLLTLMLLLNHTLRRPSPSLLKSLPQVAKSNFS